MVVVKAIERKVAIYRSANLKQWTHLSDFGPAGAVGGVWECPDLFPLAVDGNPRNVKWVMVVNLNPGSIAGGSGGQYFVGDFDGTTFTSDDPATYTPPAGTVLQDFEAPTFGSWTTTGTAFGTGPAAGGDRRAAGRHRLCRPAAREQLPQRGRHRRDLDVTGVHGEPGIPQLLGRRRKPPECPRHSARQRATRRHRCSSMASNSPTIRTSRKPVGR